MEEVPRATRIPVQCEVEFRRHGDARYRVDLLDFSPQGCCISPPVKVEPGESIWLRIPDMEAIHAKVIWTDQWKVGVEFDNPFHSAVFDTVVKRLGG